MPPSSPTDLTRPAPLWRRLAAWGYDLLLMAALAAVTAALFVALLALLHLDWRSRGATGALRVTIVLVGLAFYGWSWTHGGQTPGMRAWRIRVRSDDGYPLRWPAAIVRYATALPSFLLGGIGVWWCLLDARSRALHDLAARSEVVLDPKIQRARSNPSSVVADSSSVGAAAESIDGQP